MKKSIWHKNKLVTKEDKDKAERFSKLAMRTVLLIVWSVVMILIGMSGGFELGINLYNAIMSDDKQYKSLPKEFYRNHYQKSSDHYLDELVLFEMATQREVFGDNVYHISEKGIHAFRVWFEENIKHVPKTKHDLEYVKCKIDLYCWFNNYTFRSHHIISEFKEKYHKGEYMSHTTKDVVGQFEKQLKKYCNP